MADPVTLTPEEAAFVRLCAGAVQITGEANILMAARLLEKCKPLPETEPAE
jgi:hypothetical protein